jgi:uncharacterized protein involved in exopolysaccharide biosynthesis
MEQLPNGRMERRVEYSKSTQELLLLSFSLVLRRRKKLVFLALAVAMAGALVFNYTVGERYDAYVLLRVGQGIKDRAPDGTSNPFDGVDLAARMDSVARIGTTDFVIRQAANQVGLDRFEKTKQPEALPGATTLIDDYLDRWLAKFYLVVPAAAPRPKPAPAPRQSDPITTLVDNLRRQITSGQEGRSDILRISFRNAEPTVAADFANHLGNILVASYADMTQVLGADSFFQEQAKRLEEEAEKAAAELQTFSVSASIYSVADQRSLLLKRLNDLATQLASIRGSILEKKGFKHALVDELFMLRPVYKSKMVTGIVKNLGGPDYKPENSTVDGNLADYGEMPPLLLIKVYQDNMSTLMKVNADLAGYASLGTALGTEIATVNAELVSLTSKESEYDRLRRVLTRASAAAENYGSRTIEEKIKSDISKKSQLSSVRVVQNADVPYTPAFPTTLQLLMLTLLVGLGSGTMLAVMLEFSALRRADENSNIENGQVLRYYRRDEIASPAE